MKASDLRIQRRRLAIGLSLMDTPETRSLLESMRESAVIGGDVYMANQVKDIQDGIDQIRRFRRSMETVHVSKPKKGGA